MLTIVRELAKEDLEEGKHGLLRKNMCCTRDAAHNWEMEYTGLMVEAGLKQ